MPNTKRWVLAILLLGVIGCGGDQLHDGGFFSEFVVVNNSNYSVELEYTLPSANEVDSDLVIVEPGDSETFHTAFSMASDISGAPSPESTFLSLDVSLVEDGETIESKVMLEDSQWQQHIQSRVTVYTLTIIDQDFF